MLQMRLICVGKLKERFYQDACREYQKRLGAFCRLEILQLDEESDRPGALEKEAERIRAALLPGSFVIAMCVEGKGMSSEALAEKLGQLQTGGVSRVCVLIGSSRGLDEGLKREAALRLSMSPMTFPHHLARVMTLEQLYRALSILSGGKYHK
ncbi:MAG: 23S rRNA (pseudouridine(1915)-N(3))-methyltransferase RlmH [Clostridia bacterium]|nr:23S rRNA (pseudouridine(1915)-N(3))-methyltransferase RlmH [Clostridia bacterium]